MLNIFYRLPSGAGACLIAICTLAGSPCLAAEGTLTEIVVTAQRRSENLQAVPVSVTAITREQVEAMGAQNSLQVLSQAPSVSVAQGVFTRLTIRGNTTLNDALVGEGNVALYFDDVYRATAFYAGNEMLDVERVEVLRGPQGTLFGRNATSGAIQYVSRGPTNTMEGYASAEGGSYGTHILEAALGGPLTDAVSGRIAAKFHKDDGYQDNLGPKGGKLGLTDRWAARAALLFRLSSTVKLSLSFEAANANDRSPGFQYFGLLDPTTLQQCDAARIHSGQCVGGGALYGNPTFGSPNPSPTTAYTELDPNNGDLRYTLNTRTGIAKLNWDVSEHIALVSISAYESQRRFFNIDEDASAVGVLGGFFQFNDSYSSEGHQFTEEVRLSGDYSNNHWVAGVFYFDDNRKSGSTVKDFEAVQSPDTIVGLRTKSYAAFAQDQMQLLEHVQGILGIRFTRDQKDADVLTEAVAASRSLANRNFSGKIGIEWTPYDGLMTYASVSSAFRAGNFNTDLLFGDITAFTSVSPEKVVSYEVGFKSTFAGDRARLNGAVFHQQVKDKQGIVYDNLSAAPVSRLISLGDAAIDGAEAELHLLPVKRLDLSVGGGWLNTRISAPASYIIYTGWGTGSRAGLGDVSQLNGSTLGTGAPKWSLNGAATYEHPLSDLGVVSLRVGFNWHSESTGLGNNPIVVSQSRNLIDVRATWRSPSERWAVEAYVENLSNRTYISDMTALSGVDYAYGTMGQPRWWGIKVTAKL